MLEGVAQGGCSVTIPGSVQETFRCGTKIWISGEILVVGRRLYQVTLEVFSNLNDSIIVRVNKNFNIQELTRIRTTDAYWVNR